MYKVFIDGNQGTTGLRLFDRLKERKDIELLHIADDKRKDADERRRLINMSDVAFLCLPDDASRESVSLCENENTVIIDTSTAHRTNPDWAYGFPELSDAFREKIQNGKRIAVPGCHASGFISVVYPLIFSGIMPESYPCSCFSLTGYSGGGRKMIEDYENAKTDEMYSPRLYSLLQNHKHLNEMRTITGLCEAPVFTPIVDDYYSGMATSVPLFTSLLSAKTLKSVYEMYSEYYKDSPLISVKSCDGGDFPSMLASNSLSGTDSMVICVTGNDERITVTSIFDNLGKGASGAAVQCMNISLGLDETLSLVI